MLKKLLFSLFLFVLFLLSWALFGLGVEHFRGVPFPMPQSVFYRFYEFLSGELLYEHHILEHFFASLKRWLFAYVLAALFGFCLGLISGWFEKAHKLGVMSATLLQMMPGLAWIPFAMLLFGIGERATLFMIFMTAFPPIFLHVSTAVANLPKEYVKMGQMMGLSRGVFLGKILFPYLLPSLVVGLRIGLAIGWRVLIAAEMVVGGSQGLGYTIIQSRWSLDFESAFISIGLICLVGLFFEKFVFTKVEEYIHKRLRI
jgi:ABC-type nitrate/sulfonate/bicarbonate transport system permease component